MRKWTQAQLIRTWQPWNSSTGAVTPEGKAISKMNALKDGAYSAEMKAMRDWVGDAQLHMSDALAS
jgi:hypothetical protein